MRKSLCLAASSLVLCGGFIYGAPAALKTESFDRDPGWEGHNNRIVPKQVLMVTQDFGYSATNHSGKSVGEVGGRIQRSTTPAYYAAEIPTRTLEDKFSASGTFALTKSQPGAGVFFGFFNSRQPGGSGRPIGSLGLDFDFEGSGGRLAVRLITNTNKSCGTFITPYLPGKFRPTPIKNDGTRYHWTLAYDPAAAGGNGQFVFTMRSDSHTKQEYGALPDASQKEALARFPHTTTFTVDLTPGYKKEGATYDRFGVLNMMKSGGTATMFFDDVVIDGQPEDFSQEPKWIAMGNRRTYEDREVVGAHDFGFSAKTNHAGGARVGEVGGGLWRSGDYGYYADRVGPLNLDQKLEARGKAKLVTAGPDSDMHIGWFTSAAKDKSPDETGNFIGIHVGGPTRIGHYFIPCFTTAKGEKGKVEKGPIITPGKVFDWSLVYDPAGNNGNGEMRVTLGPESVTLALKPGQKKQGATLDRFGLFTSQAGGQMVKIFLDDLSYTAGGGGESGSSAAILEGHQGSVLSVAFSKDGHTLVSGSRDGTIKVWDVPSNKLTRTLTGHGLNVFGVTYSPKGDLLASCGGDKKIRLWDARSFEVLRSVEAHADAIRAVAFSPDQDELVSVSLDQTVRRWSVGSLKLDQTLTGHTARVKSIVYAPDGKWIATAASDRTIRFWDAKTGEQQALLEGHTKDIETLAVSPDGKTLASSSGDTTVRLWDVAQKKHAATLEGHSAEVDSVAFSPDGKVIASGSKDQMIKLWDASTKKLLRTMEGHTGRVESLAFSPDGKMIASGGGGGDTSIRLWKVETGASTQGAAEPAAGKSLPKVALLGDSIREGYAPFVAELLAGRATVVTPKANGGDTVKLLANLKEWAIQEQPDVIHFNCGIHDTKRDQKTEKYNVPPEKYEANLREIVKRLRTETKAKIVFALSTPLIDERMKGYWKSRSYQLFNASVKEYNVIARRVMRELDVPVNDLPAALGGDAEVARLHDSGGIHFTKEGSQKLAAAVAAFVSPFVPASSASATPTP